MGVLTFNRFKEYDVGKETDRELRFEAMNRLNDVYEILFGLKVEFKRVFPLSTKHPFNEYEKNRFGAIINQQTEEVDYKNFLKFMKEKKKKIEKI